jgi:hypothetical protein
MEKLKELFELCAASVTITHNENRDMYQTVEVYLKDEEWKYGESLDIDPEIRKAMIEKNQMIAIRAYPKTPIGFYTVYHWDLEVAVNEMLDILKGTGENE